MLIVFTGHRNTNTFEHLFAALAATQPGATWLHGGAAGFDSQVAAAAARLGVLCEEHRPDYTAHGKAAPHIRNRAMVARADLLVACYDGRQTGGTFRTIQLAKAAGVPVILWPALMPDKAPA